MENEKIIINPQSSCAVTGHRVISKDLDLANLELQFENLIKNGVDTFLVGMAVGFDTLCFQVLEKFRLNHNIRIIACVPCVNQDLKFTSGQKIEYKRILKSADEIIYVSQKYDNKCMMKRNMFMVDNSNFLVAYKRKNFGGTSNTVNYALKLNKNIIYV